MMFLNSCIILTISCLRLFGGVLTPFSGTTVRSLAGHIARKCQFYLRPQDWPKPSEPEGMLLRLAETSVSPTLTLALLHIDLSLCREQIPFSPFCMLFLFPVWLCPSPFSIKGMLFNSRSKPRCYKRKENTIT